MQPVLPHHDRVPARTADPEGTNPYRWKLEDLEPEARVRLTYLARVTHQAPVGPQTLRTVASRRGAAGAGEQTRPLETSVIIEAPALSIDKKTTVASL